MSVYKIINTKSPGQRTSVSVDEIDRNHLISAIEANKKYQNSLYVLIRKMEENLYKIEMKRKALNTLMNQFKQLKKRDRDCEFVKYILGAPYFKDGEFFPVPSNPEMKMINKNRMLRFINSNPSGEWKLPDRLKVANAVQRQLLNYNNCSAPLHNLSAVIDWAQIAKYEVKSRTPEECRSMWELLIRPDLRAGKWTISETNELTIVAQRNNCRNWDIIAQQLGGKRSSYQCFIHYQIGILNVDDAAKWTKSEEKLLLELVGSLKIGKNYIPWPKISSFFEGKTKDDLYTRYTAINPNIKRGCFTEEEDRALLAAAVAYNENFDAMPLEVILPGRTIKQARSRFVNTLSLAHIPPIVWDVDSDMELLGLVKKHGRKWAKISKALGHRTRASCRHRFDVLQHFMSKNPKGHIADAPRKLRLARRFFPIDKDINKDKAVNETDFKGMSSTGVSKQRKYVQPYEEIEEYIDTEFLDYFSGMEYYGDKVGRRDKTYFTRDEVKSMYKTVKSLFKIFNVTISKSKLEDQILNGNFSKYTEAEKLLLNFILDNHDERDGIFSKQSCAEQSNQNTNILLHIPTTCNIEVPHEVFSYQPLKNKRLKTYSRKCKENSKLTVQKYSPPSNTESNNEYHYLAPSFSSLVGLRTLIALIDKDQWKAMSEDVITNPSQQHDATNYQLMFNKIFHWPSVLSYANPDSEFRVDIERSDRITEIDDEEECPEEISEPMESADIQPYSKYRGRILKRKFENITTG